MINKIILNMIDYNVHDTKRINHALKVHTYSKIIGQSENINENEMLVLELASILHDIGIKECERKYNSTNGFLQQVEGPIIAKEILVNYPLYDDVLNRVLYIIGHHHTYKDIDGLGHQILLEADLIVNTQEEYITKYAFFNAVDKLFVTQSGKNIAENVVKKS